MVKLDRLQIGDYVKAKIGEDYKIGTVKFISERDALIHMDHIDLYVNEDQIYPIDITDDFLIKNGYKKDDVLEKETSYISEDGLIIFRKGEYYCNSNKKWYMHVDNSDFDTVLGCEIDYVHEYQHALKMSDSEKTVTV